MSDPKPASEALRTPRLERLERLAAVQPDDPFVHYGVGMELAALNRVDDALAAFDRVLARDGSYHAACMQKARALLAVHRNAEARAALLLGVEIASRVGDHHAADEMRDLLGAMA